MININEKEVILVFIGERAISSIRKRSRYIWQAIRSCFGAGYWRGDKPWIGKDAWKSK